MKFKYARYEQILRPIIPIKIRNGNQEIDYQVLVDSGADLCLFDAEIGEVLGIDIKKGKPCEVFGIGGRASLYYLNKTTIEVGGHPFEIEAGFMPDVSGRWRHGIVGQRGFFEKFIVRFDFLKEEVELKERIR